MVEAIEKADQEAVGLLAACVPSWMGMVKLADVAGFDRRTVLHAGPPLPEPTAPPAPIANSAALAAVYEGWSVDVEAALVAIERGEIELKAAQDSGVVVPLAGVASPSMLLHKIVDLSDHLVARYAVINEGQEHALRLGRRDPGVPEWQHWLNGTFGTALQRVFDEPALDEGIRLLPLLNEALASGDDCHNRTTVGSRYVHAALRQATTTGFEPPVEEFLLSAPAFALNLWMAAVSCCLAKAAAVPKSSLVTGAGGNGAEFGIQVSGFPGRWFRSPAIPPIGPIAAEHRGRTPVGAIGDSAVLDTFGLGGMSLVRAPEVRAAFTAFLPSDVASRPARLLAGAHPELTSMEQGVATTALNVVRQRCSPIVLLGMIDREGVAGRLGGGVFESSLETYESALSLLGKK